MPDYNGFEGQCQNPEKWAKILSCWLCLTVRSKGHCVYQNNEGSMRRHMNCWEVQKWLFSIRLIIEILLHKWAPP